MFCTFRPFKDFTRSQLSQQKAEKLTSRATIVNGPFSFFFQIDKANIEAVDRTEVFPLQGSDKTWKDTAPYHIYHVRVGNIVL